MTTTAPLNNVSLNSHSEQRRDAWVERLVAQARVDRRGVYWATPARLRASAAGLDITLAYGDAGILLALLQAYRRAPNEELREILVRGTARLRERLSETGFRHGFYAGTSGAWFLFSALEAVLPELAAGWREDAREQLRAATWEGELPGNLLHGIAGTLVGLRLLRGDPADTALPARAWAALLGGAKPHPDGVIWDFNPTSFQPPVGLVSGSAGIDLALAGLPAGNGLSAPALLGGSLAYARGRFDPKTRNWPDQDASRAFQSVNLAKLQENIANGRMEAWTARLQPEDAIGWGAGTVGVLQSRAFVAQASRDTEWAAFAEADCDRAIKRLAAVTPGELSDLDGSIFHGFAGLALGLRACRKRLPEDRFEPLEELDREVRRALAQGHHRGPTDENDSSLFSGVAGFLYADLALVSPEVDDCISVLTDEAALPPGDPAPSRALDPFLDRRLPLTSMQAAAREALQRLSCMSLNAVREVSREADAPETETSAFGKAREHEWSLYEDLASCRFQELLWRELSQGQVFAAKFDEGMDGALLGARFELAPAARLLALDCDPHARPFTGATETVFILRQQTSSGVIELRLTPLQHALLEAFIEPAPALAVIAGVVDRIDQPGVSQRQLADFAKSVLRRFVQAGYLSPVRTHRWTAWLDGRRTRKARAHLFPRDAA